MALRERETLRSMKSTSLSPFKRFLSATSGSIGLSISWFVLRVSWLVSG